MADAKKARARDIRFGRRGGGWLPDGHDPNAEKAPIVVDRDEKEEERKARQRAQLAEYEAANDIVPGTAVIRAGEACGGQDWAGRARMAAARRGAGQPLDADDLTALARAEAAA